MKVHVRVLTEYGGAGFDGVDGDAEVAGVDAGGDVQAVLPARFGDDSEHLVQPFGRVDVDAERGHVPDAVHLSP